MDRTKLKRRQRLRETACLVSDLLFADEVTGILLWQTPDVSSSNSDGYEAEIGTVAGTRITAEIWLDRFTGSRSDRFYAGLRSGRRSALEAMFNHAPTRWKPQRVIESAEIGSGRVVRLLTPLADKEYQKPLVEHHVNGQTFWGFYDPSPTNRSVSREYFARFAATFFSDVARACIANDAASAVASEHDDPNDYVGVDRSRVARHRRFDRDPKAAAACKRRDGCRCRVCGFHFASLYGALGENFAESHHLKPLAGLRKDVKVHVKDLRTVCANCHRMLHRMKGGPDDIPKLQRIIRRSGRTGS